MVLHNDHLRIPLGVHSRCHRHRLASSFRCFFFLLALKKERKFLFYSTVRMKPKQGFTLSIYTILFAPIVCCERSHAYGNKRTVSPIINWCECVAVETQLKVASISAKEALIHIDRYQWNYTASLTHNHWAHHTTKYAQNKQQHTKQNTRNQTRFAASQLFFQKTDSPKQPTYVTCLSETTLNGVCVPFSVFYLHDTSYLARCLHADLVIYRKFKCE